MTEPELAAVSKQRNFKKTLAVINGCNTMMQLKDALNMIGLYNAYMKSSKNQKRIEIVRYIMEVLDEKMLNPLNEME